MGKRKLVGAIVGAAAALVAVGGVIGAVLYIRHRKADRGKQPGVRPKRASRGPQRMYVVRVAQPSDI